MPISKREVDPRPSPRRPARDLVFVSSGLELDGGGRAAAGRLLADSCARYAAERGLAFAILTLGRSQAGLALEVWRRQLVNRRIALVFDLLGPARVQAYLPAPLRAPYLIPLYGIEVWRTLDRDRRRALEAATVKFAISDYTVERAGRRRPEMRGTSVVPLALEEREPQGQEDAELLARLGQGFFVIVGRMAATERYKGHDQLLEALPDRARLVIAGDGDDRPRLEEKARSLGLGERVFFTGFVSEATLARLYERCAAFVMPSRGEGFGLVYLEAMRAGKPCVAARESAAEEVVVDGATGLLVNPDDPRQLRTALDKLLDDPERARGLGEAGRERWRNDFGTDRFRARLEPLLERLTG